MPRDTVTRPLPSQPQVASAKRVIVKDNADKQVKKRRMASGDVSHNRVLGGYRKTISYGNEESTTTWVPESVEQKEDIRAEIARVLYERVEAVYHISHNFTKCTSLECVFVISMEQRTADAKSDEEKREIREESSRHVKELNANLRGLGLARGEAKALRDVDLFHECEVLVGHHNVCKAHVVKFNISS